jgi:quinoprotein glucose dehydrogenase
MRFGAVMLAASAMLAGCVAIARDGGTAAGDRDWRIYGGTTAADHYSPLTQIDRRNVGGLKEAWRFETGEGELQTSPLMIGGIVYAVDPQQGVVALDAATGQLRWRHAPQEVGSQPARGLTYWTDGRSRRLFSSNGSYLIALDAETGTPAREFGTDGRIDLREGLGRDPKMAPAYLTTPGVISATRSSPVSARRRCIPPRRARCARSTCAPASCAGSSTSCRGRARRAMKRGRRMRGRILAGPTSGPA